MRQLALVPLFLGACFSAGEPPLVCSADRPGCPVGLVCIGQTCTDPNQTELGQVVDMNSSDLISPVSQCADNKGFPVGKNGAWSCPGVFTIGKASSLCKNAICSDSALIVESDCLAVSGGFFISTSWGATAKDYSTPANSECLAGNAPNFLGLYGCGVGGGIVNKPCNGFRSIIICNGNISKFICSTGIDTVSSTNPANGVLCCPK